MEAAEFTNEALSEIRVRLVERGEEARYQEQMAQHHYLGALAKIGETAWYVATWRDQWVAQLSFSAAALKCGVRDRWIGWDLSLAVWAAQTDRQQQSLSDTSRVAPAESGLKGVVADRTTGDG